MRKMLKKVDWAFVAYLCTVVALMVGGYFWIISLV